MAERAGLQFGKAGAALRIEDDGLAVEKAGLAWVAWLRDKRAIGDGSARLVAIARRGALAIGEG